MTQFNYKELEDALDNTFYFVEADSFARHALWVMYVHNPSYDMKPIKWQEVSPGWLQQIPGGTCIGFSFAYIYGKLVCFYSPTSTKVDWDDVKTFIQTYCNKGKGHTNATNFCHCVAACKDKAV